MANIIHNRLTNQQVRTLKPGVYTDGGGRHCASTNRGTEIGFFD